jgi:hypothetical protein
MFISMSLFCLYMAFLLQSRVMHTRWSWHEKNCGMLSGDPTLTLSVQILQVLKMSGFSCHVAEACAFLGFYAAFVNR